MDARLKFLSPCYTIRDMSIFETRIRNLVQTRAARSSLLSFHFFFSSSYINGKISCGKFLWFYFLSFSHPFFSPDSQKIWINENEFFSFVLEKYLFDNIEKLIQYIYICNIYTYLYFKKIYIYKLDIININIYNIYIIYNNI